MDGVSDFFHFPEYKGDATEVADAIEAGARDLNEIARKVDAAFVEVASKYAEVMRRYLNGERA